MTDLRRALLQGRPVGRLGSEFSSKIVKAARQRASEMDAPPAWILPDAPNAVAPRSEESAWQEEDSHSNQSSKLSVELVGSGGPNIPKINGIMGSPQEPTPTTPADRFLRLWLPSLAVVLALCALVLFLPRKGSDSDVTTTKKPSIPEDRRASIPDSSREESPAPNNSIATTQEQNSPSTPKPMPVLPGPELQNNSKIADSPESLPNNNPDPAPSNTAKMTMVLVADISVDKVAKENEMLTQLLDEYEIIFSEDAVLKDEERSQFANALMVKLRVDLKVEDAKIYVIKGSLTRIDSFLQAVEKQKADFPRSQLSGSVSPVVVNMIKQLDGLRDVSEQSDPKAPKKKKVVDPVKDQGYLILMVRDAK